MNPDQLVADLVFPNEMETDEYFPDLNHALPLPFDFK